MSKANKPISKKDLKLVRLAVRELLNQFIDKCKSRLDEVDERWNIMVAFHLTPLGCYAVLADPNTEYIEVLSATSPVV